MATSLLVTAPVSFTLKLSSSLFAELTGHRAGYSRDALTQSQADGCR